MGEVAREPWVKAWVEASVWLAISGLVQLGSAGCGSDLGECDTVALTAADPTMSRPYEGQRLVHQSCASGQCHSEAAKGEARVGAPADLNFDLIPASELDPLELARVTRGESTVDELAEEMWTFIDDGSMPPEGQRMPLTGADKETVRNWLACGAPTVKKPLSGITGPDWAQIFPSLAATCGACHGATSPTGAWLVADDLCATRANLLADVAVGPSCASSGSRLVVPSSPDTSLLVSKLESPMPCGTVMPPDRAPGTPSPIAAPLREWIAAGAPAPGCP